MPAIAAQHSIYRFVVFRQACIRNFSVDLTEVDSAYQANRLETRSQQERRRQ
jgi:hypothetical protein